MKLYAKTECCLNSSKIHEDADDSDSQLAYEGSPIAIALEALDDYERLGRLPQFGRIAYDFNVAKNTVTYVLSTMGGPTANDASRLLNQGFLVDEIRINIGFDEWGNTCAVTEEQAAEIVQAWKDEGLDTSDLPDLLTLKQWLTMEHEDESSEADGKND